MEITSLDRWIVFIGIALAIVVVDVDITAVNIAISTIGNDLNASLITGQWIVNGYTMAAAAFMAFGGRCGDFFGRKRVFVIALIGFLITSLAVGFSNSSTQIITARILQGTTIAFTFPLAGVILRTIFPMNQQGYVMGLLLTIVGASQAIGPSFGGAVIHWLDWRWIFFINGPIALISFALLMRYLPNDTPQEKHALDFIGLILIAFGLFGLLTALNEASVLGIGSSTLILLLLLSTVSLVLFVHREWTHPEPLLALKLLLNHNFSILISTRLLMNFIYFSWLFTLGVALQHALGFTPLISGFLLLTLTLAMILFAAPIGKAVDRIGCKKITMMGFLLITIANLGLIFLIYISNLFYTVPLFILSGLAITLLITANGTAGMKVIDHKNAGAALGVIFTCAFFGGAVGVAMSGYLISMLSQHSLQSALLPFGINSTHEAWGSLSAMASGSQSFDVSSFHFSPEVTKTLPDIVIHAFNSGYVSCMSMLLILSLIGLMLTHRLTNDV